MSVELESLVQTLYVVGGRAVHAAPPGALVQPAPRRSPRARAQDTFFALLDIGSGGGRAPAHPPAALYEQLVRVAADTYFRSTGTMTSGLREAIDAANDALMAHNRETGAGYRAHLLGVAVRSGEVYVARVGACQSFLQQSGRLIPFPADTAELQSIPLGLRSDPPVGLAHYTVAPGDVLTLTDRAIADLNAAKRDPALKAVSAAEVVNALKPLAVGGGRSASALVIQFVAPGQLAAAEPAPKARKPKEPEQFVARLAENLPRVDLRAGFRQVGKRLALGVARLTEIAGRLLDTFFPEPGETGTARIPTSLAAGLTVLIAFVVTVVVVGLLLRNYGRDRCEDFIRLSETEAAQAKGLTGHNAQAREAWEAVKVHLEQALEVCPPTDPRAAQALEEARGFIDEYDQVVRPRPSVTLLRRFPADAVLHGPLLHAPDIYVLDTANVALYRDQLSEDGVKLVQTSAEPVLHKGDTVDGYVIETLVDMEWMGEGTARNRNMLVTLEPTRGVMIAYSPTLPPSATPLQGWEAWVEPVAISTWGGNFYILDRGADQIWRYRVSAATGDYTDPPERYFATLVTNPDLENAVDMGIDDQGNVYILFADGHIAKYFGGEPAEFDLQSLPVPLRAVRAMCIDSGAFAQSLYLVDAGNKSIFETTLRGNFAYHFRAANEDAFTDLRGMCVRPGTADVYVVANGGLYHFTKQGAE